MNKWIYLHKVITQERTHTAKQHMNVLRNTFIWMVTLIHPQTHKLETLQQVNIMNSTSGEYHLQLSFGLPHVRISFPDSKVRTTFQDLRPDSRMESVRWFLLLLLAIVKKIPNSGSMSTTSPSVKMNIFFRSFLHVRTTWICCAATDSTGSSIRLNSSKQPQLPDWARPGRTRNNQHLIVYLDSLSFTSCNRSAVRLRVYGRFRWTGRKSRKR